MMVFQIFQKMRNSHITYFFFSGFGVFSLIPLYYNIHWLWLIGGLSGLAAAYSANVGMVNVLPILHPAMFFMLPGMALLTAMACPASLPRITNVTLLTTLLALYGSAAYWVRTTIYNISIILLFIFLGYKRDFFFFFVFLR